MNALMRTTTAPTVIKEIKTTFANHAEAVMNFRMLPGDNIKSVYDSAVATIGDDRENLCC